MAEKHIKDILCKKNRFGGIFPNIFTLIQCLSLKIMSPLNLNKTTNLSTEATLLALENWAVGNAALNSNNLDFVTVSKFGQINSLNLTLFHYQSFLKSGIFLTGLLLRVLCPKLIESRISVFQKFFINVYCCILSTLMSVSKSKIFIKTGLEQQLLFV